jgi:alpha-galactosidase
MKIHHFKKNVISILLTLLLVTGFCVGANEARFRAATPPENAVWLETLKNLHWIEQDYRIPGIGISVDENPITLDGKVYPHGVGTHATSTIKINLYGNATEFASMVGVDDEGKGEGSVCFQVIVDGKVKADSGKLVGLGKPVILSVNLTDAQQMTLLVTNAGDDYHYDHADWAGAYIVLKDPAKKPTIILDVPVEDPIPIATQNALEPRINGPRVIGTTPGRPFLFKIPVSGKRPIEYSIKTLPDGLILDSGILKGSVMVEGTYKVRVKVKNAIGKHQRNLTIIAGEHKLALTPPMGWNSWNIHGLKVSADDIKRVADSMIETGLADVGFSYVNIDDGWENGRDSLGYIQPNEKFPDMKTLADYVHSKGLKIGIYSSPGPQTCGLFEGSYGHERQDAEKWTEWGIDYLKYDWCLYDKIAKDHSLEELQKPYLLMRTILDELNRDIVYSICQYGMGKVWQWGRDVGGNLWRTTGDIKDTWESMSAIGFEENGEAQYSGPGHWNDPDMLVVGWVGWGDLPYPTRLKPNEQITHITLWALQAAPMILGCDLSKLDPFALNLLKNPEVIDINQDPLGIQAKPIFRNDNGVEVWMRPCWDKTYAVGLFNRSSKRQNVTVNFSELGLKGTQPVRDVWQNKDLGKFKKSFTVEVPIHGAVFVKIGKPSKKDY